MRFSQNEDYSRIALALEEGDSAAIVDLPARIAALMYQYSSVEDVPSALLTVERKSLLLLTKRTEELSPDEWVFFCVALRSLDVPEFSTALDLYEAGLLSVNNDKLLRADNTTGQQRSINRGHGSMAV